MNVFTRMDRLDQAMSRAAELRQEARACNCIGPQNGQPVCPCQMRGVTVENGRYVKRVDLGPARNAVSTARVPPGVGDDFCQACSDLSDGFYGSYAPLCPVHGKEDSAVCEMLRAQP